MSFLLLPTTPLSNTLTKTNRFLLLTHSVPLLLLLSLVLCLLSPSLSLLYRQCHTTPARAHLHRHRMILYLSSSHSLCSHLLLHQRLLLLFQCVSWLFLLLPPPPHLFRLRCIISRVLLMVPYQHHLLLILPLHLPLLYLTHKHTHHSHLFNTTTQHLPFPWPLMRMNQEKLKIQSSLCFHKQLITTQLQTDQSRRF